VTVVPLTRLGVPRTGVTHTGDTADGFRVMSARAGHPHHQLSYLEIGLLVAVLGVAAAVGIPEFLQLQRDANDDTAKTRLVDAGRALESRHATAGTFAGATLPAGVKLHASHGTYCVQTTLDSRVWHATRQAKPATGACSTK
jgi:Tfp pilus assembly protein PilE